LTKSKELKKSGAPRNPDPYVELEIGFSGEHYAKVTKQEEKTTTFQNKVNAFWKDEEFEFVIMSNRPELILRVKDAKDEKNQKLGMARIDLSTLVRHPFRWVKYELDLDTKGKVSVKLKYDAARY